MLDKLEIKGTRDTPEVIFDPANNQFTLDGNSMPEDAPKFWIKVFDWVAEYVKSPQNTKLVCTLEYFNSTSAKMLFHIFIELAKIQDLGKKMEIYWYIEPNDKLMEEKGLEFKEVLDIPFFIKEKDLSANSS